MTTLEARATEVRRMPTDAELAEVRARLAASGLLKSRPPGVPKVDPAGSDARAAALVAALETRLASGRAHPGPARASVDRSPLHLVLGVDDDEVDEPDGSRRGATTTVVCGACRHQQQVAIAASGFRCAVCERGFRYAICGGCGVVASTLARQESWRCGSCGSSTRSWWRTITHERDAVDVARRRRADAAAIERSRRRTAVLGRRRWIVAEVAVGVVLIVALIVGVAAAGSSSPAANARATCEAFGRFRSALSTGSLATPTVVRGALRELVETASQAEPGVAAATNDLAAAGPPGTASFLIAQTALSDACAR